MTLKLRLKPRHLVGDWLTQIQWFYFHMRVHEIKQAFKVTTGLMQTLGKGPMAYERLGAKRLVCVECMKANTQQPLGLGLGLGRSGATAAMIPMIAPLPTPLATRGAAAVIAPPPSPLASRVLEGEGLKGPAALSAEQEGGERAAATVIPPPPSPLASRVLEGEGLEGPAALPAEEEGGERAAAAMIAPPPIPLASGVLEGEGRATMIAQSLAPAGRVGRDSSSQEGGQGRGDDAMPRRIHLCPMHAKKKQDQSIASILQRAVSYVL
jgi:hypothetical protein